jgi:hypothetical protein
MWTVRNSLHVFRPMWDTDTKTITFSFFSDHMKESADFQNIMTQFMAHIPVAAVPVDRLEDKREINRCLHVVTVSARNLRSLFTQASPYNALLLLVGCF